MNIRGVDKNKNKNFLKGLKKYSYYQDIYNIIAIVSKQQDVAINNSALNNSTKWLAIASWMAPAVTLANNFDLSCRN